MPESIKRTELLELLREISGSKFVSFTAKTVPSMRKTDNPYWDSRNRIWKIRKVAKIHGTVGFDYAESVNEQLRKEDKEANFVPEPRKWGRRIEGTPLVHHVKSGEERFYLEVKIEDVLNTAFYTVGERRVLREEIEEFLYDSEPPSTQERLENKIIVRDYSIDSIVRITYNLKTYEVIENM